MTSVDQRYVRVCVYESDNKPTPAKSPSSCGSSSHNTAIVTDVPVLTDSENAAPRANPSMKLCTASPKMIIHATGLILPLPDITGPTANGLKL